ncbi:MAG: nucleoside recognition domain-containing protein [Methylicorpusculum sp.]|uniref:nucleoside recognition domain-containing protein n=1 Tax=Methylicorpusculum sp. TaxID=2713644 RepID=UPI00271D85FE|nr:spore maturation protein [Methylicorpusculum sp.]MDO8845871.1 nucleoside recognition domain-containing protein [Methylicorpusculum sp.]MDO8939324.1 nucleoside recognition domain-containing protein [Methylicorpusculum sp.]MDO9240226.1 nucleoside recognition domain-containing protein [Methylicorpusculum sp.]MDP2201684.1 nucleoside recognition domain-containing protein [Methylicorpusculum sp.]
MLNLIWVGFFLFSFIAALIRFYIGGDDTVFAAIMASLFSQSKAAFEIALGLTGVLTLWLGIMKIGEQSGFIQLITQGLTPLFRKLMPEIPDNHPALGAMIMNLSANALGLDNAATPLGIKAMHELQTLNPNPDTASNAQIIFLVINTSAVTLFPVTIFTYRAQLGAANPTDVFIPILIATYFSTLIGFLAVAAIQKINVFDKVILAYLGGFTAFVGLLSAYFFRLEQAQMLAQSALLSNVTVFSLIIAFIVGALYRRVDVYSTFIEGAKEGFQIAVGIIPYLVAMLVAIGVFRASGALEWIADGVKFVVRLWALDDRFVDALPTGLMKPFSGSGSRAMMIDTMQTLGADSFAGRLSCIVQGSTETTFYVLAVYFGAVGIKHIRHAAACGIIADFAGLLASIFVAYWFFA